MFIFCFEVKCLFFKYYFLKMARKALFKDEDILFMLNDGRDSDLSSLSSNEDIEPPFPDNEFQKLLHEFGEADFIELMEDH